MSPKLLKNIRKSVFDSAYAKAKGVSPRMLAHYVESGFLVRLGHGVYAFPEKLTIDFDGILKEKLTQAPNSIVGLKSALKIYGLTEEAPAIIDLFVSEKNVPKRKIEDVHFHTVKAHLFAEGVTRVRGIPVTSVERTIIDVMRKKGTISQGLEIIRTAQQKGIKVNFGEILKFGELFRIKLKARGVVGNL